MHQTQCGEMVYTADLKSAVERHIGSSPITGTNYRKKENIMSKRYHYIPANKMIDISLLPCTSVILFRLRGFGAFALPLNPPIYYIVKGKNCWIEIDKGRKYHE
jgi:hypothetical protein